MRAPITSLDEPANVSSIFGDFLRVRRASAELGDLLRTQGYTVRAARDGLEVLYEPSGEGGDLENEHLIALLRTLASRDVAFLNDFKQLWPPAALVSELIGAGTSFDNPRATAFDGSRWLLWPHPWSGT